MTSTTQSKISCGQSFCWLIFYIPLLFLLTIKALSSMTYGVMTRCYLRDLLLAKHYHSVMSPSTSIPKQSIAFHKGKTCAVSTLADSSFCFIHFLFHLNYFCICSWKMSGSQGQAHSSTRNCAIPDNHSPNYLLHHHLPCQRSDPNCLSCQICTPGVGNILFPKGITSYLVQSKSHIVSWGINFLYLEDISRRILVA